MNREDQISNHPDDEKRLEDTHIDNVATNNMFANAASATAKEHKMSLWQGIKLYPKAIGWAASIAMCCAMEGYDISLIGNFYAFPPFNQKYGELQPNGDYQVPARWQAGISNGAQCGQIIGLLREFIPWLGSRQSPGGASSALGSGSLSLPSWPIKLP